MATRKVALPLEAYATNLVARREMIWTALNSFGSNVKDKIAYLNRKAGVYGPIVKEAAGIAYEYISTECLAVCEDKVDERLSAKYGWESKITIRNREIAALIAARKERLKP